MKGSLFAAVGLAVGLFAHGGRSAGEDLFQDVIAPILQRRCLTCHDDVAREGSLSLQQSDSAFVDGYIEAGSPETSRLMQVIELDGGSAEMPKNAEPLSQRERDTIRKWIAAGAHWPEGFRLEQAEVTDFDWWSFRPIHRPPVPLASISNSDVVAIPESSLAAQQDLLRRQSFPLRTPIDAFVLEKLNEHGLTPSQPADRRTLLRRVTFDLIGLPPTPQEVEQFVHDSDPAAYEKRVDALLASKHYGERWARHWLDVVKYADTCGYDKDKLRPSAWPYRDYVIRSFNDDKPYARFVQEQIAGDVLFPGEPDGILGLGFIAAGPWDFIGHVEVPESKLDGKVARNLDRDDMVSGALNTFCSLTVQCARCHHHKFDPITQQQYYGLQAIFAAVDRAERPYDLDPETEQQRRRLETKIASLRAEIKRVEQEIQDAGGQRLVEVTRRIDELTGILEVEKNAPFGYHSQIAAGAMTEKWVEVDLGQVHEISQLVLHPCHDDFAGIGAGFGFPVRYRIDVAAEVDHWQSVSDCSSDDVTNPRLADVVVELVDHRARYLRVTATRLAERKDDFIFALAELEAIGRDGSNLAIGKNVTSLDSIESPQRWTRSNLTDGQWARYNDGAIAQQLNEAERERAAILSEVETTSRVAHRAETQRLLAAAQEKLKSLPTGKMVYAAATHFSPQGNFKPTDGTPRPIHVLHRGDVAQEGPPARPAMLPLGTDAPWQLDLDTPEEQRRAALARWLADPKHPLVWRSIVNRIWQYHFGEGLVATPNDFGRMGVFPTHLELLDWLATEFRDGGDWMSPQSIKSLHRLIVTSSVYRQSSTHDDHHSAIDGDNRYLWRMNRRRLEAEEIRDSILAVSGVLNDQMGGPGFQLFVLERTEHSPHYEYHKFDPSDPSTHRRSVYRFIVRSQPDPWMTTLDCADSSQSTPRRTETLTSLQALSLLNSRFNLVMAQAFAQRLAEASEDLHDQVGLAFELVAQRPPSDPQREEMTEYARQYGLPNLCRLLFNLSEFIYLD